MEERTPINEGKEQKQMGLVRDAFGPILGLLFHLGRAETKESMEITESEERS